MSPRKSSKKKFTKSDYNEHDTRSKQEAKLFFENRDLVVTSDKQDYYTYDLGVSFKGSDFKVEVEHKMVWDSIDFPYNDIQIPYRKNKNKNVADIYIMFNRDYTALAMIPMYIIQESDSRIINTKYTVRERFFAVDVDKFKFFTKNSDGKWELYKDTVS